MNPSTPREMLTFLIKSELIGPEEAKLIAERGGRARRQMPWDQIVQSFESIISRAI